MVALFPVIVFRGGGWAGAVEALTRLREHACRSWEQIAHVWVPLPLMARLCTILIAIVKPLHWTASWIYFPSQITGCQVRSLWGVHSEAAVREGTAGNACPAGVCGWAVYIEMSSLHAGRKASETSRVQVWKSCWSLYWSPDCNVRGNFSSFPCCFSPFLCSWVLFSLSQVADADPSSDQDGKQPTAAAITAGEVGASTHY